jgi:hypothetical protein
MPSLKGGYYVTICTLQTVSLVDCSQEVIQGHCHPCQHFVKPREPTQLRLPPMHSQPALFEFVNCVCVPDLQPPEPYQHISAHLHTHPHAARTRKRRFAHTHLHQFIHSQLQAHTHTTTHACMHAHAHTRTHLRTYTHLHPFVHSSNKQTHNHACMHAHTHSHACTYTPTSTSLSTGSNERTDSSRLLMNSSGASASSSAPTTYTQTQCTSCRSNEREQQFFWEQGFDKFRESSGTLEPFEGFDVQIWETSPWAPPPTFKISQLVVYV